MTTLLRIARLLRAESLDVVAAAIGTRKAWLSTIERFPERHVSKKLKRQIEAHFGAKWSVLSAQIDGAKLGESLLASASLQKVKPNHAK
jgi:hypothetical protein